MGRHFEFRSVQIRFSLLFFHSMTMPSIFPTLMKKEDVKSYIKGKTCLEWHNGFLLADGSKFPLFQCPGLHNDACFDKDGEYSINCQVHFSSGTVFVLIGLTKSLSLLQTPPQPHDCRLFCLAIQAAYMIHGHSKALKLSKKMSAYLHLVNGCGLTQPIHLKHGQYHHSKTSPMGSLILTRGHSITTYQRYELYNVYHLVYIIFMGCRFFIWVEHAIGLLKGWFQSLFQLCIQIYTHERHLWAIIWICCCLILHNLIL